MKYPVKRYTQTVTIAAEGTTANADTAPLYGFLVGVKAIVPALVGTTTLTIAIKDTSNAGSTIYSKASIAEGAPFAAFVDANNYPLRIPLDGVQNIVVTASNAQTGVAAPIPVTLLLER